MNPRNLGRRLADVETESTVQPEVLVGDLQQKQLPAMKV